MADHTAAGPQASALMLLLGRAIEAYNSGRLFDAEQLCREILAAKPDLFDALHLYAVLQSGLGRNEAAVAGYDRALTVRPDSVDVLINRGNALHQLGRFDAALASYDGALVLQPNHAGGLFNRG